MAKYKAETATLTVNFFLKPGSLKTKPERKILMMISANFSILKKGARPLIIDGEEVGTQSGIDIKGYKRLLLSTGLSIPDKFWDNDNKQATGSYSHFNESLANLKSNITKLYESLKLVKGFKLTPENFQAEIKKHIFNVEKEATTEQVQFTINNKNEVDSIPTILTDYIEYKINQRKRLGGKRSGKGVIKNYNKFKNAIIDFEEKAFNNVKFDLTTLTDKHLQAFIEYLLNYVQPNGQPYKLNYIAWFKTQFKLWIKQASIQDDIVLGKVNIEKDYIKRKETEEANDVNLDMHKLNILKSLEFKPGTIYKGKEYERKFDKNYCQKLALVRDLFIVNCNNGFRFSDMVRCNTLYLDPKTNEYFFILSRTVKTRDVNVKIPVLDNDVVKIWEKYGKTFPMIKTDKNYRECIKDICLYAGFIEPVQVSTTNPKNMELITTYPLFYTLCKSKTARKTFCSNLVREYSLPLQTCIQYSTHSGEEQFRTYIDLKDDEYNALTAKLKRAFELMKAM